ncbi:DUF4432 family protein [Lichenicola sp.]|uniref:DUF4432 family protein n=1 Tax=Lichenicola sp. TaxID=2804529 RepID=UPI003AFF78B1
MRLLATLPLDPDFSGNTERQVIQAGTLSASLFRYPSGIAALRIRNGRGSLIVLPWFGQMIWHAEFDGVDLTMRSGFEMPLPADSIGGTYGCFAFHSGLLRNGVPSAADTHAAHGEFPTARMRRAWLELFDHDGMLALRVVSERDHVVGFGPHYLARPAVTLTEASGRFDITLDVENRSGRPMELMYMAHVNFAFVAGGTILQAAPFTPAQVAVRTSIPAHVVPTDEYRALIDTLAVTPERMQRLEEPASYDPEQVFYVSGLGTDATGRTALMLRRPEGDAFVLEYAPSEFPFCVRWILNGPDQSVGAFALPSTCLPEGYIAERARGHVRLLPPRGRTSFSVGLGHLDIPESDAAATAIAALQPPSEHRP